MVEPERLACDAIRMDGGTQPRAAISMAVAEEYAEAIVQGADLPPVVVFFDGEEYWLADGFHRLIAHQLIGLAEIAAEVHVGARREAILYCVGANAAHGMRRTNEDKRRAVMILLGDPEWAEWSDREIARRCAVDHKMVGVLRPRHTGAERQYESPTRKFIHPKTGEPSTMSVAAIGRSAPADDAGLIAPAEETEGEAKRRAGEEMRETMALWRGPMAAIETLANAADPDQVLAAWAKFRGEGQAPEMVARAAAWLLVFSHRFPAIEAARAEETKSMLERISHAYQ